MIEKFRPVLKKALNDLISEMMNDKIKIALGGSGGSVSVPEQKPPQEADAEPTEVKKVPTIVTTEEELEAYFIIKNMLSDVVSIKDITYKDTESYINILYKGNSRKWICRLRLTETQKLLFIPDENKKEIRHQLTDIYELTNYKDALLEVLKRYIS